MADKFGPFINRLMTTIMDQEQDEFVKDLAWGELNRLKTNLGDFLRVNSKKQEQDDNKEKQLLQEEKNNE